MNDIYGIKGNGPVGVGTEIISSSGGGLGANGSASNELREFLTDSYKTLKSTSKSKSKSKGNMNSFDPSSKSKNSQTSQPNKRSNSSSGFNQGS